MKHTYFPCGLNVRGKKCLVVGDDHEAVDKAAKLKKAGAGVVVRKTGFRLTELRDQFLVIYCPKDNPSMTRRVAAVCRKKRILLCAVDQPDYCDIVNVSIYERGPLKIAIGTDGVAPGLSRKIRKGLEASLASVPLEKFMQRLARERKRLNRIKDAALRREKLLSLVEKFQFKAVAKLPKR